MTFAEVEGLRSRPPDDEPVRTGHRVGGIEVDVARVELHVNVGDLALPPQGEVGAFVSEVVAPGVVVGADHPVDVDEEPRRQVDREVSGDDRLVEEVPRHPVFQDCALVVHRQAAVGPPVENVGGRCAGLLAAELVGVGGLAHADRQQEHQYRDQVLDLHTNLSLGAYSKGDTTPDEQLNPCVILHIKYTSSICGNLLT